MSTFEDVFLLFTKFILANKLLAQREEFTSISPAISLDYFSIDWDVALKLDEQNINYSTESFLNKINSLLSNYAPLKKINKYKLRFQSKPWITTGLQKSISVKNKFLTNFIKKKDPAKKTELNLQYKNHKNLLSTLLKKSKENYYKKCFESNWNNAKIIWKGIKSVITLKDITSSVPRTISQGENLITNPNDIANIFNNYFLPLLRLLRRTVSILISTFRIFSITSAIILYSFSLVTVMK